VNGRGQSRARLRSSLIAHTAQRFRNAIIDPHPDTYLDLR
jgi:hypothetical protein